MRGSPAYPYEVGFAFFEAAIADAPNALAQAAQWWWLQLAVDPGRGRSNGSRPLDYADVLHALENVATKSELAFVHLLGSWEESRGPMEPLFGSDLGPVRLLETTLTPLDPSERVAVLGRFMKAEARWLDGGGSLTPEHRTLLERAWRSGCAPLTSEQRQTVKAAAPDAVGDLVATCPD